MTGQFVVDGNNDGDRLDRFVASTLDISRSQAERLVTAGLVKVDGQIGKKSLTLDMGATVSVVAAEESPSEAVVVVPDISVRFEDEHLAVVSKPAGLVVHTGAGTTGATLVDALQALDMPLADTGDADRPGIVHRLDRGTSGLLVIAKSEAARAGLVRLFKSHDVERRYWSMVDGTPSPVTATIQAPIARDTTRRTRFRVDAAGRPATTHYDLIESYGRVSCLKVRLETGRTHQVRVHLSAVGHPVVGDSAYGADTAIARDLGLERPALHAEHLGFTHPVTGEWVALDEPLPLDLQQAERAAAGAPDV